MGTLTTTPSIDQEIPDVRPHCPAGPCSPPDSRRASSRGCRRARRPCPRISRRLVAGTRIPGGERPPGEGVPPDQRQRTARHHARTRRALPRCPCQPARWPHDHPLARPASAVEPGRLPLAPDSPARPGRVPGLRLRSHPPAPIGCTRIKPCRSQGLMTAPLIVQDAATLREDRQEIVLMLHDFSFGRRRSCLPADGPDTGRYPRGGRMVETVAPPPAGQQAARPCPRHDDAGGHDARHAGHGDGSERHRL